MVPVFLFQAHPAPQVLRSKRPCQPHHAPVRLVWNPSVAMTSMGAQATLAQPIYHHVRMLLLLARVICVCALLATLARQARMGQDVHQSTTSAQMTSRTMMRAPQAAALSARCHRVHVHRPAARSWSAASALMRVSCITIVQPPQCVLMLTKKAQMAQKACVCVWMACIRRSRPWRPSVRSHEDGLRRMLRLHLHRRHRRHRSE
jgi:hypothetical protein